MTVPKFLLAILIFSSLIMSQPANFTSRIIEVYKQHIFLTNPEGIYYGWDWQKLPDMPLVVHESWLKADLNCDISAIDEQGNLWLILLPQLVCYNQSRKNWRIWILPPQLQTEIGSIEFWQNNIWLATEEFLWCFHIEQQWWEQVNYPQALPMIDQQYTSTHTRLLKKFSPQQLWLNGTCFFDGKYWHTLPPPPVELIFWSKTAECFTLDHQGFPWIATTNGIYYYSPQYQCWRIAPGRAFQRAYSITQYQGKILAVDYGSGLYQLENNDWQAIFPKITLPHLTYTYSLHTTDQLLCVDTYFGIGSFDGKDWQAHYDNPIYQQQSRFTGPLITAILLLLTVMLIVLRPSRRYWRRKLAKHLDD